jgi:hypothetical protein
LEFTVIPPNDRQLRPKEGANTLTRLLNSGEESGPYAHMSSWPAGSSSTRHSHTQDEIMTVLDGSAVFEGASYPAGTVIMIPAHHVYQFKAGENGLTFMITRVNQGVNRAASPGTG